MAFVFMDPRRNLQARLKKGKKSKEAQEVLDRLDNYLEGNIAEPVRWLVRFWGDQAAVFTYKELRSIVTEASIPERIFNEWYQDYSRLISGRMTSLWKESFLAASHSDPRLTSVGFNFDFTDRRVKNWILNRTGELITKVTGDQVEAVKYIIAESKMKHMGAAETARYIRPIVGLNQRQAAANLKYYDSMKEQLKKDHPRMKDESIEKKAREAAAKYAGKQQRERAHTIAETEMAMAYNHGMAESIRQAVNKGILPVMRKVWSTSDNGHVCEACEALEGTELDMDKEFSLDIHSKRNPDMVLRTMTCQEPPIHPRCHCAVLYEETDQWVEPESEYRDIIEIPEESNNDDRGRFLHYENEETFESYYGNVTARQVKNFAENNVYIADDVVLTPKEVRKISRQITQAKAFLGVADDCKVPMVIINTDRALASYNPVTDIFFISTEMANEADILRLQTGFACPEDSRSTMVHELFHWKDAKEYRQIFGKIESSVPNSVYSIYQREKAYKKINEYEEQGIIDPLYKISNYAYDKLLDNDAEEAYTEIRTYLALQRGMIV